MSQTRLHVTAPKAQAQALFAALEAEFEADGPPLAIFEIDEGAGIEQVSLYVEGDPAEAEARMRRAMGDGPSAEILREELPDIDWVAKSLEGLKPVRAGCFLVHGAHDREQCGAGDICIEIEAGQAFGTGHHGTTSGCLELIEDVVRQQRPGNALDLGAGSAVLAIAIARLASIPVMATDIDPVATEVATRNIGLNGVASLVEAVMAAGFNHPAIARRGLFGLIVANILAGPLMELAPEMARHVAPGGSLILSGILERQGDEVLAAYVAQGFRHVRTLLREGWVTLHLRR